MCSIRYDPGKLVDERKHVLIDIRDKAGVPTVCDG
jgi:hypothetical protein